MTLLSSSLLLGYIIKVLERPLKDVSGQDLDIYFNIRPSGTEPLLRVNLQYHKRNIKVITLNKLKKQIIKVISDAC